jgi:myo-inositol 2-dehydrogenase/D-chiro-inositol 1-dehydrogenase
MKNIKIGAVGIGRLGATHARNITYQIPQAELFAVCSRTLSSAQALQKELEVPFAYDDFDEMLANKELDAICITTYTRFHPEQILKALEAGLAVFCDKPIAENYESSKKIVEEIQKHHADKICMIGYMKRYDPSYAFVKKEIEAARETYFV